MTTTDILGQSVDQQLTREILPDIPLTVDDYHFVNYPEPERFFRGPRPYRLVQAKPELTTYTNAIYVPSSRTPKVRLGSIYDENLRYIDATITRRGRDDVPHGTDPEFLTMDTSDLEEYDRPVLYLGLLRPHFGHYIMESLSYWWALLEDYGDVDRFLFHVIDPSIFDKTYVKSTLGAMNIDADRIVYFDKPMKLKKVIVPTSTFQVKSHVYTSYRDAMNRIAQEVGAGEVVESDQPLFLSRTRDTGGVRRYIGEEEVEAFLAQQGVRIAYPGQLSFAEQAKLVNEHKCIMGFQGSQLLNSTLSLTPKTLVQFTDNRVWANHMLVDKCYGHDTTYVKAAGTENGLREIYRATVARLTGKRLKFDGFGRRHLVDVEGTIAWLKTSGFLN